MVILSQDIHPFLFSPLQRYPPLSAAKPTTRILNWWNEFDVTQPFGAGRRNSIRDQSIIIPDPRPEWRGEDQ